MRKILAGIGIVIGLLIIVALVVPMFIPAEAYKARLEREASSMLGRTVTIGAVPKAALFPNPSFTARDLTVANAPGMEDEYFVSVTEADIGVKLFPLLSGNVEIDRFVLTEPDINLERLADGTANWAFDLGDEEPAQQPEEAGDGPVNDIRLGDVRIVDGAITYRDRASGQTFEASDADITLGLDSLDAPLTAEGTMQFQGRPARLDATVETPRSLMNNAATVVGLFFAVEENEVDADINLAAGDLSYDGQLAVDAPSLRSLLATLGMGIDATSGFERLAVSGAIAGTGEQLSFRDADLSFDEISGNGDIDFAWGGARPKVTGEIDLSQLDLRPYLPAETPAQQANREDPDAGFPAWPAEPIDFSPLTAIDADISATTDGITLPTMQFGRSALGLTIENGLLNANLSEVNLYEGGGSASLMVNARRQTPSIETVLDLSDLNAQAFARDVLGLNRLTGIGGVEANLSTSGRSVADFISALNGQGTVSMDRGAMEGIDIGKIVRAASTLLSGFAQDGGSFNPSSFNPQVLVTAISEARAPGAETEFNELSSPFTITDGVVRSQNIVLQGPLYSIAGEGTVNLPQQAIDMAFVPTVFSSLEAETGRQLNIPLMIGGTFNEPTVRFDTRTLLQGVANDRIRGLLSRNGVDVQEGQSVEDALRSRARSEIGRALGLTPQTPAGQSGDGIVPSDEETGDAATDDDAAADDAADAPEEEASIEDQLKERALDAIFGGGNRRDRSESEEE